MKLYEEDYPLENTLGLAFNLPNDTGEIHELLLEKSGDVKTVYKLDGFGTIQKNHICTDHPSLLISIKNKQDKKHVFAY